MATDCEPVNVACELPPPQPITEKSGEGNAHHENVGDTYSWIECDQERRGHLGAGRHVSPAHCRIDGHAVAVWVGIDSSHLPQVRPYLRVDRVQRRRVAPNNLKLVHDKLRVSVHVGLGDLNPVDVLTGGFRHRVNGIASSRCGVWRAWRDFHY